MNSLFNFAALILTGLLFKQVSALETIEPTMATDDLEKSLNLNFYVWLFSLITLSSSFLIVSYLKWKNYRKEINSSSYQARYSGVNGVEVDI